MSTGNTLLAALETLHRSVSGIEEALAQLEARPAKMRKSRDHQMDLFSASSKMMRSSTSTSEIDTDVLTLRIDRVIAQIETVLDAA